MIEIALVGCRCKRAAPKANYEKILRSIKNEAGYVGSAAIGKEKPILAGKART